MKPRSAVQPPFRNESTPATIKEGQLFLNLKQLTNNNNSANFINNIHPTFMLPKSRTKTRPTFDKNTEKFELFKDLFQTDLKFLIHLTEGDKIKYFHSLMTLEAFKKINSNNQRNLGELLAVFPRKYFKPHWTATAKQKLQKLEKRNRKRRTCHHWTNHLGHDDTTPEKIKKSVPSGNKLSHTLKSIWIRTVWKLLMRRKTVLPANMVQTRMTTIPNQQATNVKKIVDNTEISVASRRDRKNRLKHSNYSRKKIRSQ